MTSRSATSGYRPAGILLLALLLSTVSALTSPQPISTLLSQHGAQIAKLKSVCSNTVPHLEQELPYSNDVFFLRYCLSGCDDNDAEQKLKQSLEWRTSDQGRRVCGVAAAAVDEAVSSGGWKNDVVLKSAPHAQIITNYITPSNCVTTTSSTGDLVYCVRAGSIDDVNLLQAVTIDQMVEFFLYTKEVNAIVADMRSSATNKLLKIVNCNDLSGVKLVGGSADFRKALSQSSNKASIIYPSAYNGPTLLLNLPLLVSALVKLFTPLFSESVKKRLKFQQGPLKSVTNMQDVATRSTNSAARTEFVQQLDEILYS